MSTKKKQKPAPKHTPAVIETPAVVNVSQLPEKLGHFDGNALVLADGITLADWKAVGVGFARVHNASGWAMGDWLNQGARFEKDGATKKAYKEAIAATGIDYGRLRTFASIANRFPSEKRNPLLSFEHHRIMAPMKNDDKVIALMDKAVDEKLSAAAVRELVPKTKPKKKAPETDEQRKVREAKEDEAHRLNAQNLCAYFENMPKDFLPAWVALSDELSTALANLAGRISTYEPEPAEGTKPA